MLHFHGLEGGMDKLDALQKDYNDAGEANRKKRELAERTRLAHRTLVLNHRRATYDKARKLYMDMKRLKPDVMASKVPKTIRDGLVKLSDDFLTEINWLKSNITQEDMDDGLIVYNRDNDVMNEQLLSREKELYGWGIAEDKRMINAKSPWTLAHMNMKVLQAFYNNPAVPPSMKTKLKNAMMMKSKKKLVGGLAGVSKASGFIQRMMAENKKKHGTYKKPTDPAHKDSTMSKWRAFDYKKLANSDQGGEGEAAYGASPFIQKYFKNGTVPFTRGNTAKETEKQKEARLTMMAKRLARLAKRLAKEQPANQAAQEEVQEAREAVEEVREAPEPVETPAELLEHFGNLGEPMKGLEVKKVAEEATPANPKRTKLKLPKKEVEEGMSILSDDVLSNRIWSVYVCFWKRFIKRYKKVKFSNYDWVEPFASLTYSSGGFWKDFYNASPIDISSGRKEMYKDFLMKWEGYKENELVESRLEAYPDVKFFTPRVSEAEADKRKEIINDKKNLMGWSYILWISGKLVKEHSYTISMEDAEYSVFNKPSDDWITKRGERIILKSPEGKTWDITSMLTHNYDGKGVIGKKEYGKEKGSRVEMTDFWEDTVYSIAEEADIDIDDNVFAELEPDDGVDRDAMKAIMAYIQKETRKLEEEETKKPKKLSGKGLRMCGV